MSKEIENLKPVSVADIKDCLKKTVPNEFDKMIISQNETVKRANYFYVKHKSTFITREGKIIKFPLYDSVKDIFADIEGGEKKHGEKSVLSSEKILEILKTNYKVDFKSHNLKSVSKSFEFPIDANNDEVTLMQRKYFLSNLTFQEECDECKGKKYIQCQDPDCRGQHVYECPDCKGSRKVKCDDCRGTGWEKCNNCSGTGEIKCSNVEVVEKKSVQLVKAMVEMKVHFLAIWLLAQRVLVKTSQTVM